MITDLAKKAGAVNDDFAMRIADVPNKTEIERINRIGVKEIDLSLTSYISSFEKLKSTSPTRNVKEMLLDTILGIPSEDHNNIKNRSSIMTSLRLNRGRFKKDEIRKNDWLTNVGSGIIDAGFDDYKIILEDGTKISSSNLKIVKSVNLKKYANTFSMDDARQSLSAFYQELKADGRLGW